MHGKLLIARMRKFGINFIATFLFSFFRVSTKIFCSHKDIITEETVIPLSHDFFFFFFLGLYLELMQIPRLGIDSELQLLAYVTVTATATPDLS